MLEAMGEKQVTVDNVTWPLDQLFFVIATQNPHDQAGTYPLPVAQLDRFLFKIKMDYIDRESEIDVLATRQERRAAPAERRIERDELVQARYLIDGCVHVHPAIHQCLVDAARNLRGHRNVMQGLSTRSLVLMIPALQAAAMLFGRDYVSTEDISFLAPHVFAHRLMIVPGAGDIRAIIDECLAPPLEKLTRMTFSMP
jgi:MoxR-like ATPase